MKLDWKNSLLLALVFVVGFGLGSAVNLPAFDSSKLGTTEKGSEVASVMIDYGDGEVATYSNVPVGSDENLFQVMGKIARENNLTFESKEYEGLGVLVTKIGNKENGVGERYWQYWVDHKKPEVGASLYVLESGDFVEWKFVPFKGE